MRRRRPLWIALSVLAFVGLLLVALRASLGSGQNQQTVLVRYERSTPLDDVLKDLSGRKVVTSPVALRLYARLTRRENVVPVGTYAFKARIGGADVLDALARPIRQMVRLPETNWARRTANLLERAQVCTAKEYLDLVAQPELFASDVSFSLPTDSLEGYLYPDTYDLPPLIGAKETIRRQLKAFDRRVWQALRKPSDLHRAVIIASMVELEAAKDKDRPLIAGVIENRLKQDMPLQIDATINYGMQKWRPLKFSDYRHSDTPYNTYLHTGLPPGPICSPTTKSVEAALHPAQNGYLYYVAMPDHYHAFAVTYEDHLKNIQSAKEARKLAEDESK